MTTSLRAFFAEHHINPQTREVNLDLIEDIYTQTNLTAYPVINKWGCAELIMYDGYGGTWIIGNGTGGLPDGISIFLDHDQTAQEGGDATLCVSKFAMDGGLHARAQASALIVRSILATQKRMVA
jgi:hypothetical protein